ncbi:right-handed parallel beta-helix repeat-containing protein [Anaerocolumna xylanovorans]|uniref:Right handed beta helix region n=1 Tax=Anaerocolumna xylanovorans DSM 12503 TaxID=1121345 RepID=A0A1M7Y6Q3_9FIRM|nr:right-handed parallel beta-helix repeat-containing protein [Anaerocolumna xylanovorans]SHO48323.1 hypothetical protein SAMN02745217_01772 [Anaerocolumna xylanovorans DSM 12503]
MQKRNHSWGRNMSFCKRILSLILVVSLILSPTPVYAARTYSNPELARAMTLGFGTYRLDNPAVTYAQFMSMIDRTVELADKSKLAGWKAKFKNARTSKKVMTRFEGMMIVLNAANTLGGDYPEFNANWGEINDKIGEKVWDEIGKIKDPYKYIPNHAPYGGGGFKNDKYIYEWDDCGVAYRYAFGRVSLYSGKTLFDYDTAKNTMRPDKNFLYTEALLVALRLYDSSESAFPVTERPKNADDIAILDKAEKRKQVIRSSPTTVTVTGAKYYVSNSGDDNNDGLSPDKPWATLEKIRWALDNHVIKNGDGIFLERGGLWRGSISCWGIDGVTYSAYGEGEKPRIYGSPESGAGAAKWSLWYEKNGIKIWKFYKDISDCGGIVFNDGKSYATRVFSYWNGKQALSCKDYKTKFNIAAELTYDLQFYSTFDMSKYQIPYGVHDVDSNGPIYLRCDKGNPGALYKTIEFQSSVQPAAGYTGIIYGGNNIVVDNICVMYRSTMGLDRSGGNNVTYQNCEVAWVGGGSHIIGAGAASDEPWLSAYSEPFVPTSGEGIRLEGNNNKALNNYVHDCFDGGITVEFDYFDTAWNCNGMTIRGNLIERCVSGVLVGEHYEDKEAGNAGKIKFSGINITDNYIMYSGYGWSSSKNYHTWIDKSYAGNAITWWEGPVWNKGGTVSKNVLYKAKYSLVQFGAIGKNRPVFSGNVFVQNNNGIIAYISPTNDRIGKAEFKNIDNYTAEVTIRDYLGDKTAKILPVSR